MRGQFPFGWWWRFSGPFDRRGMDSSLEKCANIIFFLFRSLENHTSKYSQRSLMQNENWIRNSIVSDKFCCKWLISRNEKTPVAADDVCEAHWHAHDYSTQERESLSIFLTGGFLNVCFFTPHCHDPSYKSHTQEPYSSSRGVICSHLYYFRLIYHNTTQWTRIACVYI